MPSSIQNNPNTIEHTWRFYRSGGFDQVRLDTIADLLHLDCLDQKLWVALSCPSKGLHFDPKTLAALDQDSDGYIRAHELIQSLHWTAGLLHNPDLLAMGSESIPLSAINTDTPEGLKIFAAAKQILSGLGKPDAASISCEDTENSATAFAALPLNGDGVVTPTSTEQVELSNLISTLLEHFGGTPDRSGHNGISLDVVRKFFSEGRSLNRWREQPLLDATLSPQGAQTEVALKAILAVRDKVDDFFTRCRLAGFDSRATMLLNASDDDLKALSPINLAHDITQDMSHVAALPLSRIGPEQALPLTGHGLNPAWAEQIEHLCETVIQPLLGVRSQLSEADWKKITSQFEPRLAWLNDKPETRLTTIPAEALESLLSETFEASLLALIEADSALSETAEAIASTDRLVRYTRDLARLARNFVSFQNFYSGTEKALFQAGTLYMDGRSCDLCIQVLDPAKHVTLASLSGIYLAYCDCIRGENGITERMSIAAAFTAGDSDQLMIGRNGLFYDREGRDWHATITKIIDHPISLRQAIWSPYKKTVRLVSEQIQKIAASKEKIAENAANSQVSALGTKVQNTLSLPPATNSSKTPPIPTHIANPPAVPFDVAKFAGIFAALGLAVGAIGTALASLVHSFLNLAWWQMPMAIFGLMTLISGPSVLLALFKLRNRNLGPLLDANGWAVNTRAKINIPFGRSLTKLATLPAGAQRSTHDAYAEQTISWIRYSLIGFFIIGILFYLQKL
jgi:hypothetical protein